MTRLLLLGGLILAGLLTAGPAQAQYMLPNSVIQSTRTNPYQDWNKNGIPDYLERQLIRDYNHNGIPDYMEMLPLASQRDWSMTPSRNYFPGTNWGYFPVAPVPGGQPVSRSTEAVRPQPHR
jgi:hypothetical protein